MSAYDCIIYKGKRKKDTYLYVTCEGGLESVPGNLLDKLGTLTEVMILTIDEHRKLARVATSRVLEAIARDGYFLQMPPGDVEDSRHV